tara:strand:+ start:613 stop:1800 length:1188 start_codon:yes stop_codon:yes gene_type:complete
MALFMGVAPAIDIAWELLKNEPMHEMSNDDLSGIAFGEPNYDAGLGHYTPTENTATPEQQQQALRELELRQMEMSGNMPQVYDSLDDLEPVRQIVDFYEPQFDNKGIGDSSIPQTEKEGEQYAEDWPGELDEEYMDRIMDVRESMPGQSNISNNDYLGTYNHLKNTAPPEVAQQFLERYRDFIMRQNENPEYLSQSLTQAFDENAPAPTAPKYTQEFPTDESLFDIKPPKGVGMVSPDATGFSHDFQDTNKGEPIDLAWRLLKRQTTLPNFDMGLDETTGYQGVAPVQQVSAQPSQYSDAYLQGQYPDEFWSAVGSDPEITRGHGGSRHRADEQGNYLAVGVRGQQPVGDLPTRGPYRPRKGRAGYPQDMGVRVIPSGDMPEPEQIVTMPMRGGN